MTEQRFRAVLAVLAGGRVGEVAAQFGVTRQSVSAWLRRYQAEGLEALRDRSHRPESCPHQASPQVEAAVCQMRRDHPRWGPVRIVFELGRDGCPGPLPSRATVYRILRRHGLVSARKRRRGREDYIRWQREKPMELWQMDIVGGVLLADGSEAKVVTGVDDHSGFCVIAKVVPRQTGRAVCLAFAEGLSRYGIPEEVLTDNGKQFTDRFGKGGEVLFDRICRTNGIVHRLTQPASPTTTGKVERFHQTLERELLDGSGLFVDVAAAQAAVDAFVVEYNTRRPHQSLGMATPAQYFHPSQTADARAHEALIPLRLPKFLVEAVDMPAVDLALVEEIASPVAQEVPPAPAVVWSDQVPAPAMVVDPEVVAVARMSATQSMWAAKRMRESGSVVFDHAPVEFDRVVPPSGNLAVRGKQFWIGPLHAGQLVTFWADTHTIHLSIAGMRIRSVRSHLSIADLAILTRLGARPAGPSPLPTVEPDGPHLVELERTLGSAGFVSVGSHRIPVSERRAGMRVGIRIDGATLTVFDPQTRELLRTHPNPLTPEQVMKLRGGRPPGPPPTLRTEPLIVQRRVSNTGGISIAGQRTWLGREHARKTVTIHVADEMLTIDLDDGPRTIPRTTTKPVAVVKARGPRKVN